LDHFSQFIDLLLRPVRYSKKVVDPRLVSFLHGDQILYTQVVTVAAGLTFLGYRYQRLDLVVVLYDARGQRIDGSGKPVKLLLCRHVL
jgi:hypothetical protein